MKKIQQQSSGGVLQKWILKNFAKFIGVSFYLRYSSQVFSCEFCKILRTSLSKTKVNGFFWNHVYLNSIEQFPEFQSDDVDNFYPQNREYLHSENTKFCQKQPPRDVQACNFIKKETLALVFPCEFCKISKKPFLTEPLRWLLLFCGDRVLCFPSGGFPVF